MHRPGVPAISRVSQQAICDRSVHPTGTFVEFEREDVERSIAERFEKQVARYPERAAISTEDTRLTYRELNQAANRRAHAILARRGQRSEPVALLIENDVPMVVAMLAAL